MKRKVPNPIALLIILLVFPGLAACGGGGGSSTPTSDTISQPGPVSPGPTASPSDLDGDGLEDAADNCFRVVNPAQLDTDDNGVGDLCEDMPVAGADSLTVLGFNDLGMHCMDREFSVFSILPPFNVVHAQVVAQDPVSGLPQTMEDSQVDVHYTAVADAVDSINTRSIAKTDFWSFSGDLFGAALDPGQGLLGLFMPMDHPVDPGPQPMEYDLVQDWFSAEGIPISPKDDAGLDNPYPLLRVSASHAQSRQVLGYVDVVVPVAAETDCQNCHATGGMAAADGTITWAADADLEIQTKRNILRLHDARQATNLQNETPVLCARCHYSLALDLSAAGPQGEQVGRPVFSAVMHRFHGQLVDPVSSLPVFPADAPVEQTCYQCHPGNITKCQRGAMKTGDMECIQCHGGMSSVGGVELLQAGGSFDGLNEGNPRRPWLDLPRCQSCHTGDVLDFIGGGNLVIADARYPFRLRQAFRSNDASASPLSAANPRFAENPNTLFRFSKGHGGINCQSCHGSTHAIWPTDPIRNPNDNAAAIGHQGHSGPIIECATCHRDNPAPMGLEGPHGLHPVGDTRWNRNHDQFFSEANPADCQACHGADLSGTPLARVADDRSLMTENGNRIVFEKGKMISCDLCHGMPI